MYKCIWPLCFMRGCTCGDWRVYRRVGWIKHGFGIARTANQRKSQRHICAGAHPWACVTPQIPSQRITCSTTASPPSPWSWMNSPPTWSLCYPLQTAACGPTKGEKSVRYNTIIKQYSGSTWFVYFFSILCVLAGCWRKGRWMNLTKRKMTSRSISGSGEKSWANGGKNMFHVSSSELCFY